MKLKEWRELSRQDKAGIIRDKGKNYDYSMVINSQYAFDQFLECINIKIRQGFKHYSARTIIHHLRFETSTVDADKHFKINDHCSAHFARAAMEIFPGLKGFFELRNSG